MLVGEPFVMVCMPWERSKKQETGYYIRRTIDRWKSVKRCTKFYTELHPKQAEVPQGSVLDSILNLLLRADLSTTPGITTATFADDTTIIASDRNANTASKLLQASLRSVQQWLKKWRIKVNESKSSHVTFTALQFS